MGKAGWNYFVLFPSSGRKVQVPSPSSPHKKKLSFSSQLSHGSRAQVQQMGCAWQDKNVHATPLWKYAFTIILLKPMSHSHKVKDKQTNKDAITYLTVSHRRRHVAPIPCTKSYIWGERETLCVLLKKEIRLVWNCCSRSRYVRTVYKNTRTLEFSIRWSTHDFPSTWK